jgi:uncharacterized membrane protein YphA (DoxX/SURF4 family)
MNNNLFVGLLCILILYIYSSYEKILDVDGTAQSLHKKLNFLPMEICTFGIILVIILEGIGSLFLLYFAYTNKYKEYAYNTIIAFILFNIVVTLIYHNPFEKKQFTNFLKNLSITGGFILLLDHVKNY